MGILDSGLSLAQQEASVGDTVTPLCSNSGRVAGTQNQSTFQGMAKAFRDPFVKHTEAPAAGVCLISWGCAAGAVAAGWFWFVSSAEPPKPGWGRG